MVQVPNKGQLKEAYNQTASIFILLYDSYRMNFVKKINNNNNNKI